MEPESAALRWQSLPKLECAWTARTPEKLPRCVYRFGDARSVPTDGPALLGGDFAPQTVVRAYRAGYFPWPHEQEEMLWFSPDPRAVIPIGGLHVSRRLARRVRKAPFRLTMDVAFAEVVSACAVREGEGTWITPGYIEGYTRLHELGWAHSFEVWTPDGRLAGGLYGLQVMRMFGAESMFHRVSDASKVAMVAMMQWAEGTGIELVDVQVLTEHTERMGAVEISRDEYLDRLARAISVLPGETPVGTLRAGSGT
jgi:leucyl/phenylalanyl-tRNA--protein transferase